MAAHRYWQIRSRGIKSLDTVTVSTFQMATAPGGQNVCVGGVAFASYSRPNSDGDPNNCFTGANGGYWYATTNNGISVGYNGPTIGYDFGTPIDIREFRLASRDDGSRMPYLFDVESSDDGQTWNTEWVGFQNWAGGNTLVSFPKPVAGSLSNRFWAVYVEQTQNLSRQMFCSELQFRTTPGGPSVSVGGTALCLYTGDNPQNAFDGTTNNVVSSEYDGAGTLLGYDHVTAKAIKEVAYTAGSGDGNRQGGAPISGRILYSADGNSWQIAGPLNAASDWQPYQTKTFAVNITETKINVEQARNIAVYNIPTVGIRGTALRAMAAWHGNGDVRMTQARMMAVTKGRVANPRLRIWTFTLDAHDLVVLRLGDKETLVYDVSTEQWVDWDSADSGAWRPNIGFTWVGGQALANIYGSNVVAGDDTFGLLWFLDPKTPWDQHPDPANVNQQIPFDRIVTGQVLASGRMAVPCYAIFLSGDNYDIRAQDFTPSIVLETSDDQGLTYTTHDALPFTTDYDNPYAWYSLGQFMSPGRIFRITDNGVLTRIDGMEMNDAG